VPDPDPAAIVVLWQRALVEGRLEEAYALLHPSARSDLDLEGFRALVRRHREALLDRAAELAALATTTAPAIRAHVMVDDRDAELTRTPGGWRLVRPVGAKLEGGVMDPADLADLVKEIEVDASMEEVWAAWTTAEGARTFFAPQAKIEAQPGGPYELYFALDLPAGLRGSEGCQVLAADPPRHLVFTWNFPPSLPGIRHERTQVRVVLSPVAPQRTRVRLVHSGWRRGEEWQKGHAYFEGAWGLVMERLGRRFAQGPVDWNAPDP
jgi:uncharacterized protein YndB with AHSA1/START domain